MPGPQAFVRSHSDPILPLPRTPCIHRIQTFHSALVGRRPDCSHDKTLPTTPESPTLRLSREDTLQHDVSGILSMSESVSPLELPSAQKNIAQVETQSPVLASFNFQLNKALLTPNPNAL